MIRKAKQAAGISVAFALAAGAIGPAHHHTLLDMAVEQARRDSSFARTPRTYRIGDFDRRKPSPRETERRYSNLRLDFGADLRAANLQGKYEHISFFTSVILPDPREIALLQARLLGCNPFGCYRPVKVANEDMVFVQGLAVKDLTL